MLHTISMLQALELWSQLEQAYHGTNGYGSDTAEIYLYQVMSNEPRWQHLEHDTLMGEISREEIATANAALHDFLALFAKTREAVLIIEDKEFGPWMREAKFAYRVHVRVIPCRSRKSHAHQTALRALEGLADSVQVYTKRFPLDSRFNLTSDIQTKQDLIDCMHRAEEVLKADT